jgi:hypothetical protein
VAKSAGAVESLTLTEAEPVVPESVAESVGIELSETLM